MTTETNRLTLARHIFFVAIFLGLVLRLIAVMWGDIGPGGDGTQRLSLAVDWAHRPHWQGLSGVWLSSHFYFLGGLIRLWNEPIFLAKAVNLACGIGAVFALRAAVRHHFGDLVASVSALLLAVSWTHIWLTTAYWVELPYILFTILSAHYATRLLQTRAARDAFLAGVFLSLCILLRHEGMILFGLFAVWFAVNVRRLKPTAIFAVLPLGFSLWHGIEPLLKGRSYLDSVAYVGQIRVGENLDQGVTLAECLKQWIMMPAIVPSLFVVIPGLYGLWKARHLIRHDLFAWMFIAQIAFFLTLSFTSLWRPQLRYILLYFVNLLPYAAWAWVEFLNRFSPRRARPALAALVGLTILLQSAGWWVGRNDRRAPGWLPIQVLPSSQVALDRWVEEQKAHGVTRLKMVAMVPGDHDEPWSLTHSQLVDDIPRDALWSEVYVPDSPAVLKGRMPPEVIGADIILVDSHASFYDVFLRSMRRDKRNLHPFEIHPNITVFASPKIHAKIASNKI